MMGVKPLQFSHRRRLPMLLQAEAAECGLACLTMILGYHGHDIDMTTMRRRHAVSLKGAMLADILRLAGHMKLATHAVRCEVDELAKLQRPAILHWGMNHFVVLAGVDRNGVTIHDPATGQRHIAFAEVSREFTGVAVELTPTETFERKREAAKLKLGDLFRHVVGAKRAMGSVFFLSVGLEILLLLMPIGSQIVIDEVIVSADHDLLLTVAVGLGLALLAQAAIGVARGWIIMLTSSTLAFSWNASLFDHLSRLPLDYFEKRHVGDVISRFGALGALQKALTTDLVQAILDGLMSIGMLAMMALYGGWLAGIAVAATLIDTALRVWAQGPYWAGTQEHIIHEARQQTHFIETVRGIASIKMLGLRARRRTMWLNHLVDSLNAKLKLQRLDLVFSQASQFLFGADRLILIVLAAGMVISGKLTVGMLVAFLTYKDQFASRIGNLLSAWFQLRMLGVQSDRLSDIVLAEAEPDLPPMAAASLATPAIVTPDADAGLRVENVGLRYGESEPFIFRDISLSFPAGRSIAITGPSGCGKTTLLKVLMGLIAPVEGRVTMDGQDIRAAGLEAYRARIAGVLQDDGLFSGSIAENVCGFDAAPDLGWMAECTARAAILNDIKKMPMGFDTLVGDMGSTLSGGQKQRLVLARALYRRPEILFLDEATSHLDEKTEAAIAEALNDLEMTRIIVAHRPATIAHADIAIPFHRLGQQSVSVAGAA